MVSSSSEPPSKKYPPTVLEARKGVVDCPRSPSGRCLGGQCEVSSRQQSCCEESRWIQDGGCSPARAELMTLAGYHGRPRDDAANQAGFHLQRVPSACKH